MKEYKNYFFHGNIALLHQIEEVSNDYVKFCWCSTRIDEEKVQLGTEPLPLENIPMK